MNLEQKSDRYVSRVRSFTRPEYISEVRKIAKLMDKDPSYDPEAFDVYAMIDTLVEVAEEEGYYETVMAEMNKWRLIDNY